MLVIIGFAAYVRRLDAASTFSRVRRDLPRDIMALLDIVRAEEKSAEKAAGKGYSLTRATADGTSMPMMERLTTAQRDELEDAYARCECPTCLRKRDAIEAALRIIDAYTMRDGDTDRGEHVASALTPPF